MLKEKELEKLKKKYESDKTNKIRRRMLNKVPLVELVTDLDTEMDFQFNVEVKTHKVTDQKNSGRCWAFAGLNVLREKIIEKCNLDNFELSGSYIAFYDKLERFNLSLEKLINYKKENRDLYDRELSSLLNSGIYDGGFFAGFRHIINKYGIVPKSIYPESFSSSNTYEINSILSRLIRKFYLDLDKSENEVKLKEDYLDKAYLILCNVYGVPTESFDFEYTDKKGKYFIDRGLTPKTFYDKYIGADLLDDYVEVICYEDEKVKYNNLYETEGTSKMSGASDNLVLNVCSIDFQNLLLKQIKNKELIYFYCSTTSKRVDGIWIDILERYGDIFDFDLKLDRNAVLKTNGLTNCHCMLITGVNLIDDKPVKWKIQNSWGSKYGENGYYIATNDWINTYLHRAVINKKYLTKQQLDILENKPIKISKWDLKC